jgi:hypothetical protein
MTGLRRSGSVLAALACAGIATACGGVQGTSPQAGGTLAIKSVPPATSPAGTQASAASVKRADLLYGVSCASQVCTAVGEYYYGGSSSKTLVERWAGSTWQLEPSPDGPGQSSLQAVSCPVSTSCTAVGAPVIGQAGAHWRITTAASVFTAVSCASAGSCIAVGQTAAGTPVYGDWNGLTWRSGTMAAPPHRSQSVAVSGVSCSSPENCVAVGDYSYGAGAMPDPATYRDRILAEVWNGRGWHLLPAHNISTVDQLAAVSCTSPTSCTAVGTARQQFPLAEHWNGASWQRQSVPAPSQIGYTQLTAVSCRSAVACMAVGTYQGLPIAESWDGSSWHLQQLPRPPGDENSAQLNGVSCISLTECLAVGVSGSGLSYAEHYSGTRWQLATTQNPT